MRKFSELFNHNRIHHVSDFSSLPSSSVTYLYDPTNIGFGSVVGTPDAYTLMPSAGADILAYAYSQQQVSGSFTTNASITIGDSISPSIGYFGLISEDNATPTFFYPLAYTVLQRETQTRKREVHSTRDGRPLLPRILECSSR